MWNFILSFVGALIGTFVAHRLASSRLYREKKFELIFKELVELAEIIEASIAELEQNDNKNDFRKILLSRQRYINRKSEFIYKTLKKVKIDEKRLKQHIDDLKEHMSGTEKSCIITNTIQGNDLPKIMFLIFSAIDDIKWDLLELF